MTRAFRRFEILLPLRSSDGQATIFSGSTKLELGEPRLRQRVDAHARREVVRRATAIQLRVGLGMCASKRTISSVS
jgi:hypothetical protein